LIKPQKQRLNATATIRKSNESRHAGRSIETNKFATDPAVQVTEKNLLSRIRNKTTGLRGLPAKPQSPAEREGSLLPRR
jgi:hypothetical protein